MPWITTTTICGTDVGIPKGEYPENRLRMSLAAGADAKLDPKDKDPVPEITRLTQNRGADV